MELIGNRIYLRPYRPDDWAQVHHYGGDPEVVRYTTFGPNTEAETRRFIEAQVAASHMADPDQYGFAVCLKETGELIGGTDLYIADRGWRKGEFGYVFAKEHWGHGYATEAARLMLTFAFEQIGLHRVYATCDPANVGSWRVMEKCGMTREGLMREERLVRGRWRDSYLYAILVDQWRAHNETLLSQDKLVSRRGDAVLRPAQPWTPSVHALLRHLESVGFSGAPRVLGSGFDADGRELLQYVAGEFVHPYPWRDEALVEVGRMLRRLHDATATFVPPADAVWQPWFLRGLGGPGRVIGHGDVAPWNMVTRAGMPVALVDWEYAGPVDPMLELARTCWLFAQLHDDDVARLWGLPDVSVRARQVRLLADAYGIAADERHRLLDQIVEVAICEAAQEAIDAGVTQDSVGRLWGLAWRTRAAAWILRNRSVFEQALA